MVKERKTHSKAKVVIPPWQKLNITIEEASEYSGIGRDKLRELTNSENCPFVFWVGSKRLIRRRQFEEFVEKTKAL